MEFESKLVGIVIVAVLIVVVISYNTLGAKEETKPPLFNGEDEQVNDETPLDIYVDIKGEVRKPGVYKLDANARVFTLIEKAGGITQNGSSHHLNLARVLKDGEMIWIEPLDKQPSQSPLVPPKNEETLVNINTASGEALETLPNIGPASAKAIIEYREVNDGFQTKDELLEVSGIGPTTLEKIRELITI